MEENFDYIIAGAGMAGVALASQVLQLKPNAKVLLLEKEATVGGRLASWQGFNAVSPELVNFFADQTTINVGDIYNLPTQKRLGIIAAARVQEITFSEMMSSLGFRAVGGAAAARDWKNLAPIWSETQVKEEADFNSFWKGKPKKSPAVIVLQHFARLLGIPDTWTTSLGALKERTTLQTSGLRVANWQQILSQAVQTDKLQLKTTCRIAKAEKQEDGSWKLITEQGVFTTPSLIVAQSPWQAMDWLPKAVWPKEVLSLSTKTTPVSAVTLSCKVTTGNFDELCDAYIIPAEEVQIVKSVDNELCFQSTIDFENSLQSENVVKSVKKLKRARRKFLEAYPDYKLEGEYVALVPVGWSQSPDSESQKYLKEFDIQALNTSSLAFCGDAYGSSYDGDKNLINSFTSVIKLMSPAEHA